MDFNKKMWAYLRGGGVGVIYLAGWRAYLAEEYVNKILKKMDFSTNIICVYVCVCAIVFIYI